MTSIAITGAGGLLGSHLSNHYVSLGWNVFVLLKDEHSRTELSNKVNRVYGNINNKTDIDFFIAKSRPDYFIHLAAQTQAYDSIKYPYNTFYTNLIGTLNVLESLREYKDCKSTIVASSDKAYGELTKDEYFEDHILNGVYPYDASKSITDIICNSYRNTYDMPVVTTRACNIYGTGDNNIQRLVPGVVKAYKDGALFTIRNGGKDIREYINVKDVVSAYDKILSYGEKINNIPSFNISSGERYSTLEVFNIIQHSIGEKVNHEIIQNDGLEIKKQFMNSSLLQEKTGWKPTHNMKDSMDEMVAFYMDNK
ncbi:WcaG Nucleoside-diphosphate-sugar epimerases [uncultured Caudovirales phage]|uniref:WcaG Nucleoside-diphosphate-sugar epimerases n=1 Tax=uncultured Caudovirales phage TaxID=2100421 RepID=A0A6J5NLM8_9CAUD|nr:WcaG Nucleoside-diphosphate-sugar epimerases [uncultured Caudovirales phage]